MNFTINRVYRKKMLELLRKALNLAKLSNASTWSVCAWNL